MKRHTIMAVTVLSMGICWYLFSSAYFRIFWQYLMLITAGLVEDSIPAAMLTYVIMVCLPTAWCSYIVYGYMSQRISTSLYVCGGTAYAIGLMVCMVLKSWSNVTAWGFNFDITEILDELSNGSITPVLNIVLLIPIGFFLASLRGTIFAMEVGLCGTVLVESTEFALHLGVWDISDICTNIIGILIGVACLSGVKSLGFHRVDIDERHFSIIQRDDSPCGKNSGRMH